MRVRLRFTKHGKVRFTSHRDVARIFERALRKASVPVAYTEGFSPRPKIHFGLALPTGYESDGEYLDVDLPVDDRPIDAEAFPGRLSAVLPDGMAVTTAAAVDPATPSLQQAVTACSWSLSVPGVELAEVSEAAERAMAATELLHRRERKGRWVTDDLRPALHALDVRGSGAGGVALEAELGTRPRSLRPSELLAVLSDGRWEEGRARRTHQWIEHDGARYEPLPAPDAPAPLTAAWPDATGAVEAPAPHAEARAS